MSTAVAIPERIPKDDSDLRGKMIPELCREVVAFEGTRVVCRVEAARRFLYMIREERWRDPMKYGRELADGRFGFDQLHQLSARELGDYLGGMSAKLARALYDAVQVVGEDKLPCFTNEAIEILAPLPEALKGLCRRLKPGDLVTRDQAREAAVPWTRHKVARPRAPLDDDERHSLARKFNQLEREARVLRQENAKLKSEAKKLREDLRGAREEVAELQKRLYGK